MQNARTSGDGMEQESVPQKETKIECQQSAPSDKETDPNLKSKENLEVYEQKIAIQGYISNPTADKISNRKLHVLVPKLVSPSKTPQCKTDRKPRFVPFEPYKCAVNPIIPFKNKGEIKKNKNNLDINVLVTQMANMKTSELNTESINAEIEANAADEKTEKLMSEIENLKKEREHFQNQLKFQVQVNSELKNLLVAAVGEDMQTKVHVLTEDKLQLARALLDTAKNLSSHTEQIEYLAGQCEVWRSKFLASSVMIEELARWKADLTQKNNLLLKANKGMLQLTANVKEMQMDLLKNLKFLAKLKNINLPSADLLTISSECLNISQQIVLHSGIGMPENLMLLNLENLTTAEKDAIKALEFISQPLLRTDDAFKAIVNQAFSSKAKECLTLEIEHTSDENEKS